MGSICDEPYELSADLAPEPKQVVAPPHLRMVVDLSYLVNSSGHLDYDELGQIKAYLKYRNFLKARQVTGHHRATVARSWSRFVKHLAIATDLLSATLEPSSPDRRAVRRPL